MPHFPQKKTSSLRQTNSPNDSIASRTQIPFQYPLTSFATSRHNIRKKGCHGRILVYFCLGPVLNRSQSQSFVHLTE
ncbi:MAG: hypothetical protein D6820_17995 [Lentisphaerae bacterium]|nr:MAG: hypothetical protein D6820_17995 [Lentisphaerota bacterium]